MSDSTAIECPIDGCETRWVPDEDDPDDRRCPPCRADNVDEDGGVPWL